MALELGCQREQVGVELEEVVGGHQPGHVGRGARPQAARERDLRRDPEREVVGRVQALEAADREVAPVAGDRQVGLDGEAPRLLHLELHVQRQRRRERVEAGPEVGRRGGDADDAAAVHQPTTAFSTAAISGSHGTTAPTWSSAVCGSFSPWPVRTHATRPAPSAPYFRSPATDAALAGSQNTPSRCASVRYAPRISSSDTARTSPRDVVIAVIASSQRAGLPMRIALATVSGFSTGLPCTSGAAPAAWKPSIRGAAPIS